MHLTISNTVGCLCEDDHKGINNQYVGQGKIVLQTDSVLDVHSEIGGVASTMMAKDYKEDNDLLVENMRARRLTPSECEKLQGLDGAWTSGISDSARYRMIGNGMAQPCADYLMSVVKRMLGG